MDTLRHPEPLTAETLRNESPLVYHRLKGGQAFILWRYGRPLARILPLTSAERASLLEVPTPPTK